MRIKVRIVWGRFILTWALATIVAVGTTLGLTRAEAPARPIRTVQVRPGDTLWGIAQNHGPHGTDLRRLIYELEQTNGLQGEVLQPGKSLELPLSWQ